MSIAIYGDSFGFKETDHKFWIDKLEEKINIKCQNFCETASSLFYSYSKFLETHKDFDKIIFLVTSPFRYTKPLCFGNSSTPKHIGGPHIIDKVIKNRKNLTPGDYRLLQGLKEWFFLLDTDFYTTAQKLLVDDIFLIRSDIIVIPCFFESLSNSQYQKIGLESHENLFNLVKLQCESIGMDWEEYSKYTENPDIIGGHLTPEMNDIFADLVYSRIINKNWNKFPTNKIKHKFSIEKYYKKL